MDIDEFRVLNGELEQKIATYGKAALLKEFKSFFEEYPEAHGIRWTQNIDPCCFVLSRSGFEISIDAAEEWFYLRHNPSNFRMNAAFHHLQAAFSDTDALFKATFGGNCLVTVTRDGFVVEPLSK